MKLTKGIVAIALAAAALAAPASAQRALQVEADAVWTHPHNGIAIPTSLAGLPREKATEYAPDFLNLGFSFRGDDLGEVLTLYIYRDTNGGVPVWFEQGRRSIEARGAFANPELAFGIEQYGWPGHTMWQGQRAIYATPNNVEIRSTGLVLFSIDGWFVKMRASSSSRSPEELANWINTAFAELTPPTTEFAQEPVIAVTDCEEKLSFKKAKDAKTDGASSLVNALLGGLVSEKAKEKRAEEGPPPAVAWCRDAELSGMQVAYRANASTDSYLIALGDSGMGVSVAPDAGAALLSDKPSSKKKSYSITVITEAQRINFVPQNRLPSLQRVLEVINANRRVSATSTWGDDSKVEINPDAL